MADQTDSATSIDTAPTIIAVLEKAQTTNTALLMFAFAMFLDSAMLMASGRGLYDLYANPDAIKLSLSLLVEVMLILIFFSLFMSLAIPLIAETVRQILISCCDKIWQKLTYDANHFPSMWRAGYVQPQTISEAAHTTKEPYFLELEKTAKAKERDSHDQRFKLIFLSVACLVLSTYNFVHDWTSHASLLQHFERGMPNELGFSAMVMLILVFLALAIWQSVGDDEVWIYCPSLARELVVKIDKNAAEQRELRERYRTPVGPSLSKSPPDSNMTR